MVGACKNYFIIDRTFTGQAVVVSVVKKMKKKERH